MTKQPHVLILALFCLGLPARVSADTSETSLSLRIAIAKADEVFTGRLVAVDLPANGVVTRSSLGLGPIKLGFLPDRIWKGAPRDTIIAYAYVPHPDLLELGTDHLVLISRADGYPRADWYRDVIPILDAADVTAMLDSLGAPASPREFNRALISEIASRLFVSPERERARYIREFAGIGKEPDLLLSALENEFVDAPAWERSAILYAIRDCGFSEQAATLVPLVRAALQDASISLRVDALVSMEGLTDSLEAVVTLARSALADPEPWVRDAAIAALADSPVDTSEVITTVAGALQDTSAYVRKTAVRSLSRIGGGSKIAEEAVRRACHDADPVTRSAALGGLAEMLGPGAADALMEALDDPSAEVRQTAVSTLADEQFPSAERRTAVATAVADPEPEVKQEAGNFFRRRHGWDEPWAQSDYLRAFRGADSPTRRALLSAFTCCHPDEVPVDSLVDRGFADLLVAAFADTSAEVRVGVLRAVQVFKMPETGLALVLRGLSDLDREVQRVALGTLACLGAEAKAALPRVIALMDDEDRQVRQQAKYAYRRMLRNELKP